MGMIEDSIIEVGKSILNDRLEYRRAFVKSPGELMKGFHSEEAKHLFLEDRYLTIEQAWRLYQIFPKSGIFKALMSNPIKNVSKTESYITLGRGETQPHDVSLVEPICGLTQYGEPQVPDQNLTLRIHGPWFSIPLQDTALDFLEEETGYYLSIQDHPSGKIHMSIMNWKTGEKLGRIKVGMNLKKMIESSIDLIIEALEKNDEDENNI